MNTPQSPFAPLQKLQEEQREGYAPETITPTAMNTTENQNDPYAHLKQAWRDGRRIRARFSTIGQPGDWQQKWHDECFVWAAPPENYEIEPLPADKWAAEKTAHAQGKRIEHRFRVRDDWSPWGVINNPQWRTNPNEQYRIAPDPAQTYHTPAVVQQRREEAAAINAVMNPAPAGKLTDEQLGEIGATAAAHWFNENGQEDQQLMYVSETGPYAHSDTPARTGFAAAVREAVEKEQAEEIEKLKNAHAMEFICLNKVLPINRDGSVKIVDHAIATVRYLTAASVQQAEEIARLTAEVQRLQHVVKVENEYGAQRTNDAARLAVELAKANAELERLRWRPVSVKPTRDDADTSGNVEVITPKGRILLRMFSSWPWELNHTTAHEVSHWRPFCPPPAPTAEEKERADFEKSYRKAYPDADADIFSRQEDGHYFNLFVNGMWKLWKDFSASQEVKA